MKKHYLLLVILFLSMMLMLVILACTKKEQPAKPAGAEPLKVTFAGGEPSGVWYMLLNGVIECVNRSYPGSVVTIIPGSGITNIIRINSKEADLSLSGSDT
jgi:TRAP-type uncharacterized transport system substrate-binding protein